MRRRQFLVDAALTLGLGSIGLAVPAEVARAAELGASAKPVGVRVGFGKGWSEPSQGRRLGAEIAARSVRCL